MLKAGFRKCHRRPQHRLPLGCELRALLVAIPTNPTFPAFLQCRDNGNCTVCSWLKSATKLAECMTPPAGSVRRGSHEGVYGNYSVTVQNRTHVYMNFFHHKDLGNHLLQLCPKVVKHPVYCYLKCIVYDKLLKPRQSFWITLYLKQSSGTDRFRHVCKFQCSYVETDKSARRPACRVQVRHANLPDRQFGLTGCVWKHLFTLHPAPEPDQAPCKRPYDRVLPPPDIKGTNMFCVLPMASAWGSTVSCFNVSLSVFKNFFWQGINTKRVCHQWRIMSVISGVSCLSVAYHKYVISDVS